MKISFFSIVGVLFSFFLIYSCKKETSDSSNARRTPGTEQSAITNGFSTTFSDLNNGGTSTQAGPNGTNGFLKAYSDITNDPNASAGDSSGISIVCGEQLPANYTCFTIGTATAPHYFGPEVASKLQGAWKNDQIEVQLTLDANGVGTWTWTSIWAPPKIAKTRWGVLTDKNGNIEREGTGTSAGKKFWYVTIMKETSDSLIDTQFGFGGFYFETGAWTQGFVKQ